MMNKRLFTALAVAATPLLFSCVKTGTTAQNEKKEVQGAHPTTRGTIKSKKTSKEEEQASERPAPAPVPALVPQPEDTRRPTPMLRRKRVRRRDEAGGSRAKPLEADLGDMSSNTSDSERPVRILVIRNLSSSFVIRFRRLALRKLGQERCSDHTGEQDTTATVAFSKEDEIQVSGASGRLARCIKESFQSLAATALSHRTDDSEPVRIQVRFTSR